MKKDQSIFQTMVGAATAKKGNNNESKKKMKGSFT